MKLSAINKFFTKPHNCVAMSLLWGTTSLLAGGMLPVAFANAAETVKQAKEDIQQRDPDRYQRLVAADTVHGLFRDGGVIWTKEAREMDDSLKMDAIIQKAYFEGAQMVRDSIAGKNNKK